MDDIIPSLLMVVLHRISNMINVCAVVVPDVIGRLERYAMS